MYRWELQQEFKKHSPIVDVLFEKVGLFSKRYCARDRNRRVEERIPCVQHEKKRLGQQSKPRIYTVSIGMALLYLSTTQCLGSGIQDALEDNLGPNFRHDTAGSRPGPITGTIGIMAS